MLQSPSGDGWGASLITLLLVAVASAIVFGPAMNSPFIFDDLVVIRNNPSITRLWPPVGDDKTPGPFNPPHHFPTDGRPLINLSLAINYQIGQLKPLGYHLFNLVVHVLSATLLAAIVRRTLLLDHFSGQFAQAAWPLSVIVALLWALHPLQTESVIYVTQRTELMMAFCYLATLYCSLRYCTTVSPNGRTTWLALATIACLTGMACKEVMVTAPVVVLLFERTFVAGSFREAFRRSWPLYIGLACGWLLLLLLQRDGPHSDSAGFQHGVPAYVWWLTQTEVLWMYLKLVVWPAPLVIHYATPYLTSVGEALPWLLPAAALAIGTLVLLWRSTSVGFLAACVWLILAPTFVVPIVTEVAAERRMYLPLAALVTLVVIGGYWLGQRASRSLSVDHRKTLARRPIEAWAAACALILVLGIVSRTRAEVYRDPLVLWRHTADHQPNNPVVRNSLGALLAIAGRQQESLEHLEAAVQLKPDYPEAQCNLGLTLIKVGRPQDAIPHLEEALRLKPNYPDAHNNLATALLDSGQPQQAIEHFETAVRLQPDFSEALNNLGNALLKVGQSDKATEQFAEALRVKPDNFEAHSNMAGALIRAGRPAEAIEHCQRALELKPDYAQAHNNLSVALLALDRTEEACDHAREAARLLPNSSEAQYNAGNALANSGRPQEAIDYFVATVRLQPDDVESLARLASCYARVNRTKEAVATAEKAFALARTQGKPALYQQLNQFLTAQRALRDKSPGNPAGGAPASP